MGKTRARKSNSIDNSTSKSMNLKISTDDSKVNLVQSIKSENLCLTPKSKKPKRARSRSADDDSRSSLQNSTTTTTTSTSKSKPKEQKPIKPKPKLELLPKIISFIC